MIEVKIRRKPDRQNWQLYYVDPLTGVEKTKSARTSNLADASRAAQRWQDELQKHGPASNPPWEVFRDRFSDEVAIHQRPGTKAQYKAAFDHWERIIGKPKYLASIMPTDISRFQSLLARELAMPTVVKTLRHLRAAFNWAEKMGMIPRAPKIAMPKLPKRKLARARPVTPAEFAAMVKAVRTVRPDDFEAFERLLTLISLSGFRLEESLIASWDRPPVRIDLDGGRYPRVIFHAAGQKSDSDEIWLMPPDLAAWLRKTPVADRRGLVAPVIKPGIDSTHVSHIISDIGKAAMVTTAPDKWASAHDIRRAFGTRWAKSVKPLTLQRLMRHASIETTLAYYVDHDESAVGEELWGKTVPPTVPAAKSRGGKEKNPTPKNKRKIKSER